MFDFTTHDSFEIEKSLQYTLSIQVSLDGFSFTAVDTLENQLVAFKTTPLKISNENLLVRHLKDWLESESFLKKRFKNVMIFVHTETFTIIPEEFSELNLAENLNSMIFNDDETVELTENKIAVLDARLVFPVQRYLIGLINQFFNSNKEIFHPLSALLSNPVKSEKRNCAVIITNQKYFHLVVYRNGQLLLANSYQNVHQTDLVYHVLNSFQQLKIARSETEMFICSSMNNNTDIADLLQPYFSQTSQLEPVRKIVNHEWLNHSLQLYLTTI